MDPFLGKKSFLKQLFYKRYYPCVHYFHTEYIEVLVPLSESCGGARGVRMPRFASEAMRDLFLYRRLSHTMMMTNMSSEAHWYVVISWYSVAPELLPCCIPPSAEESCLDIAS